MKKHDNEILSSKSFEVSLLIFILISIITVFIDSVQSLSIKYAYQIKISEMICGFFFSIEYIYRIYSTKKKLSYIFSFIGIVDLLSIIPFYIGLINIEMMSVTLIRSIRFIRIFRILKLANFLGEEYYLLKAIRQNINKITVFLVSVCVILILFGSTMYLIEGEESGFTSIPKSIYWAIVTMTTVGYGDIAPKTFLGQFLASMIMLLGYVIIAVPTGIVLNDIKEKKVYCQSCSYSSNPKNSKYCGMCGKKIS